MNSEALEFDKKHIWHPYTSLTHPVPVFEVESAEGAELHLSDGGSLIDGMASWWSTIHGYNHPQLNGALKVQCDKMAHVMFGGLTHEPAITLCQKLVELTDDSLECVFLADSGSVSVEVALKMALQYWFSQGKQEKTQFLTIKNGYHGDTLGAMSVCDPENGMHSMFAGVLPQHLFVEAPTIADDDDWQDSEIEPFKHCLQQNHQTIAAVILEPLVQGAGGMRVYCPEYLRQVRQICDQYGILLILDEIATGFGRTGTLFAYEQAQIAPDILCLGKALTGGYMSLAATICTRKVADKIGSYAGGNLMHGPTFMGNPLACAVANKSIELLLQSDWQSKVLQIEKQLIEELTPLTELESVFEVRIKGAIGVVELKDPVDMHEVQPRLVELGVWLRPFGKLLYTMPPYIISEKQLHKITRAMAVIAREACK
ncbi:adenosylmethionine--8-amino-7-oxononanoate transaminase [Aliikangiella sp. G2MR2-5]|uniref:adenosylmethionine--8-amino-7-oxononanoate transaminase n=1 Tax=Aliikangiella sp. G2MR2-5 TaxID=2788943 RepID=UPI0018A986E4|nr:adenosylmethionine--8-amino-7-oxononanoate transaminase [Aliikangiella sp. G2MR2-5]